MLLRASGEAQGERPDVRGVTGAAGQDGGVRAGRALAAFAEAAVAGEESALSEAREAVRRALGDAAAVDAAAVIGNFERMVRIADATGIPLDGPVLALTGALREELGLDAFPARAHSPEEGPLRRALGRLVAPWVLRALALGARRAARRRARG